MLREAVGEGRGERLTATHQSVGLLLIATYWMNAAVNLQATLQSNLANPVDETRHVRARVLPAQRRVRGIARCYSHATPVWAGSGVAASR